METIRVSAFRWVPPFAQGLVRDLRVRWALEEAGIPYETSLIGPEEQKSEQYRKLQPFGQVPAVETTEGAMFESGAIVMHLAESSEALMPKDPAGKMRVQTWMFSALNTVEPPITMLNILDIWRADLGDTEKVSATVREFIGKRLDTVTSFLGDRDHLVEGRFTAADLLMVTVLRALRTTDMVTARPTLAAYQARGEARPAFQRALAAQMRTFDENAPPAKN